MIIPTNAEQKQEGGIDLTTVKVYIGNYLDTENQIVEHGTVDKYSRQLVS